VIVTRSGSTCASPFALWCDEEFDAALDASKATFDSEERQELTCEALEYMREEAPCIFLVQTPVIQGVAERVQGYTVRPDEQVYVYHVDVSD
jgi:dipeptide transport system substrate-binding protein